MRRRVLKMSGQTDRERAADLMAGGANAFKDYMFFSDEQDRSSFPTDNLAAQCAFVIGHLPGCDTKHITAPTCARPEEDVYKFLLPCMGKKASTGRRGSSTCAACGFDMHDTDRWLPFIDPGQFEPPPPRPFYSVGDAPPPAAPCMFF